MGVDAENKNLVIKFSTLIKRSCIPKDIELSHPPTILDEKNEMTLICFINLGLKEQEVYDFPEDFLR